MATEQPPETPKPTTPPRGLGKGLWVGLGFCTLALVVTGLGLLWMAGRVSTQPMVQAPRVPGSGAVVSVEDLGAGTAAESMPNIRLLGTWVAHDPSGSLALLGDTIQQKQAFVRLGNHVGPWELARIEATQVVFQAAGDRVWALELDEENAQQAFRVQPGLRIASMVGKFQQALEAPSPERVAEAASAIEIISEEERVVDRARVIEAVEGNPLALISQGRVMPHLKGLSVQGLRVTWMADSPWGQKVGIEAGDIVKAVNGLPIVDPSQMGEILTVILSAPEVLVTIERGGEERVLRYRLGAEDLATL